MLTAKTWGQPMVHPGLPY